jgi:pyrroloquinoline-quinone synthase
METKTEIAIRGVFSKSHEFEVLMDSGRCTVFEIQQWVRNRYAFQKAMVQKDLIVMYKCDSVEFRRTWIKRIIDHDEGGGIDAWLQLGESVGLSRDVLTSHSMLLPGVKFAVDGYFNFCKNANYVDSMTSSLTELFAPHIHMSRLESWPTHYPWINMDGYTYFKKRLSEARRDVNFTLDFVLDNYITYEEQQHALSIIDMKLNVLWCMLDSIEKYSEYNKARTNQTITTL